MARIWQEGFEAGLMDIQYLGGDPLSTQIKGFDTATGLASFPYNIGLGNGRNVYSQKSLRIIGSTAYATYVRKILENDYDEVYFRVYFKISKTNDNDDPKEVIGLIDNQGDWLFSLYHNNNYNFDYKVKTSGTYQNVLTGTSLVSDQWYKLEVYFKVGNGTGAYEIKLDDVSLASGTSDNTGTINVKSIHLGHSVQTNSDNYYFDDIAINDTTGTVNNSWCGNGTIIGLKPKANGNYSQWDASEGYAKAESGTNTTTIKITGHGLSTNDVIYNKTLDEYRIATVTDANTLTVSSVTGQAQNDIILMYKYQNTITNTIPTTSSDDDYVVIDGHNIESGDLFVNTTVSNSIRRVIFVDGNKVYNKATSDSTIYGAMGSNISAQKNGDSIDTYKFHAYAITNHYESVFNDVGNDKSHKFSYIQSNTANDIDSFDMEELVNDKGVTANVQVNAISLHAYAYEGGAGSQFQHLIRLSTTDYTGTTKPLSGGLLDYNHVWNVNPNTTNRFTQSEIDSIETGVKVVT